METRSKDSQVVSPIQILQTATPNSEQYLNTIVPEVIMPGLLNPDSSDHGVVYIDLPTEFSGFLANSEKNIMGYFDSFTGPLDRVCTPLRKLGSAEAILTGNNEAVGLGISFFNSGNTGLILKCAFVGAAGFIIAINLLLEGKEQQERERVEKASILKTHQFIHQDSTKDSSASAEYMKQMKHQVEMINQHLAALINEDPILQEKYACYEIEMPENAEDLSAEICMQHLRIKVVGRNAPEAMYLAPSKGKKLPKNEALTKKEPEGNSIKLASLEKGAAATTLKNTEPLLPESRSTNFWNKWAVGYVWEGFFKDILWTKLISPFVNFSGLVMFMNWLLSVSVLILTGVQLSNGIYGIPTWLPIVGLPLMVAPLVGLRIYNWIKHGHGKTYAEYNENARLKQSAEEDFAVLEKALKHSIFQKEWAQYYVLLVTYKKENGLKKIKDSKDYAWSDEEDLNFGYKRAGVGFTVITAEKHTFLQNLAGYWVNAGLSAFIGATMATPIGYVILGLAILAGLISTIQQYEKHNKRMTKASAHAANAEQITEKDFDSLLAAKTNKLNALVDEIYTANRMYKFPIPESLKRPEVKLDPVGGFPKIKAKFFEVCHKIRHSDLIQAWGWNMTGIMVAQIVVPVTSLAIFWAFTSIAVLASLSNPVTLGVIVGVGLLFTAFKYYESYKAKKAEKYIKGLEELREIEEKTQFADLVNAVRQKDQERLNGGPLISPISLQKLNSKNAELLSPQDSLANSFSSIEMAASSPTITPKESGGNLESQPPVGDPANVRPLPPINSRMLYENGFGLFSPPLPAGNTLREEELFKKAEKVMN